MIHLCIMPNSKQMLIDAAVLVLSRDPSAALSTIAEKAGVQRVTLHRHFGSREALIREVALFSLNEMDSASKKAAKGAKSYTDALRKIVAALVPIGDRFHFLWNQKEVWEDRALKKRAQKDDKELIRLIEKSKKEGGIDAEVPNAWILASIEAVVFMALNAVQSGAIAPNDAPELAVRTLFNGIGGTKKKKGSK